MNIAEIITPERALVAADIRSKKRALEVLAEALSEATPYLTATEIFTSLVGREKLGSTGLGDGVAIPHGRMKGVEECVGAMLRIPDGVDFAAPDDYPVDLIFALLVPQDSTEDHLQILRRLAETFTDESSLTRLREAEDGKAMYDCLVELDPIAASD